MSNESWEIMPAANATQAIVAAEVDLQIATAKKYPRSVKTALKTAEEMATSSVEIAEECRYLLPRGGKKIEGPSVRLAEIMATAWGNIRIGSRVIEVGEKTVTAQGVAHDLETNQARSVEVVRRITDSRGRRYNDDMIVVTARAASAIAEREAVLKVIPRAYTNRVLAAAKQVALGKATSLNARRDAAFDHLLKVFGVDELRTLAALGVASRDDVGLEDLDRLRMLVTAIKDGEVTIEDAFPYPHAKAEQQSKPEPKAKPHVVVETEGGEIDFDAMTGEVVE